MSKRIAILGASTDRSKYGNKSVRAYLDEGWEVFPVNPGADEIEGREAYAEIGDVPGELDRISIYLPPPVTRKLLDDIAEKGAGEVWFNPGADDDAVVAAAKEKGLNVVTACSIVDIGRSPSDYPG